MRVPNGFPEVPSLLRGSGAAPVVNLNFRPGLSGRDVRGRPGTGLRLDHRPGWMRGDPRWTAGIVHPAGYTDSLNTERISYINRARVGQKSIHVCWFMDALYVHRPIISRAAFI